MKISFKTLGFCAAFLTACSHTNHKIEYTSLGKDLKIEHSIVVEDDRIDLVLINLTDRNICYSQENWPNKFNDLHFGSDILSVIIDGKTYKYFDQNLGYPPPPARKLAPTETLKGELKITKFGLKPEQLEGRDFELEYKFPAHFCD